MYCCMARTDTPSEKDRAEIAKFQTEAMAKYVQGQVDALMSEKDFLVTILGLDEDKAEAIGDNVVGREDDLEVPELPEPLSQPSQ